MFKTRLVCLSSVILLGDCICRNTWLLGVARLTTRSLGRSSNKRGKTVCLLTGRTSAGRSQSHFSSVGLGHFATDTRALYSNVSVSFCFMLFDAIIFILMRLHYTVSMLAHHFLAATVSYCSLEYQVRASSVGICVARRCC